MKKILTFVAFAAMLLTGCKQQAETFPVFLNTDNLFGATATLDKTSITAGEIVTLTVTAEEGRTFTEPLVVNLAAGSAEDVSFYDEDGYTEVCTYRISGLTSYTVIDVEGSSSIVIAEPEEPTEPVVPTEPSETKPFLLYIEDVFTISGRGVVVTGRVQEGEVSVGNKVDVIGFGADFTATVLGIEMFRKQIDIAVEGDNVGILISANTADKSLYQRGMALVQPGMISSHTKFKADITLISKEEGGRNTPITAGYKPQFYFYATDITGALTLPSGTELVLPGESVNNVEVELISDFALRVGDTFAIRESGRTVGTGTVTEIIL